MSSADNLRGSSINRRLDRNQWSEIQRVGFDLLMSGVGEYYMEEPIIFGRAFSHAPTFSFSANVGGSTPQLPQATVAGRNGGHDVNGLGWNSNVGANRMSIHDPWFEYQGQHHLVADVVTIPTIDDHFNWPAPNVVYNTWTGTVDISTDNAAYPKGVYIANCWLQGYGEARGRWELSDDRSYKPPVGDPDSNWSAKYVLVDDGSTNVLVPWAVHEGFATWEDMPQRGPWDIESSFSVVQEAPWSEGVYSLLGWSRSAPPPVHVGWLGYASVWADQPGTLRIRAVNFRTSGHELTLPTDTIPSRRDPDGHIEKYWRIMNDLVFEVPVAANQWNTFDVRLDNERENWPLVQWPNPPSYFDSVTPLWRFEYSFVGSAGTTVYLDNLHLWQNLKNGRPPIITIGVAKWLIDDFGAYIGAHLWFKVGNPS